MEADRDDGKIRFPNRDSIGSTFIRKSDLGEPALDSEPATTPESADEIDLSQSGTGTEDYVSIDRGDGFVWRVRIKGDDANQE